MSIEQDIFQKGSTTYYWSSRFFPAGLRDDIFKLYSFVRVVDDYVDEQPQNLEALYAIERRWKNIKRSRRFATMRPIDDSVAEKVLSNICYLTHRYNFDPNWINAFFDSMKADARGVQYNTLNELLKYIYGSAEVVGLMMASIMQLDERAYEAAKMQGRAMQYINFIRDIAEDESLGRQYFPTEELKKFGIKAVTEKEANRKPAEWREFIEFQIKRYSDWQHLANQGFKYIPRRLRTPIRTAADMYAWTAECIHRYPHIIFEKNIKPSRLRILRRIIKRSLYG